MQIRILAITAAVGLALAACSSSSSSKVTTPAGQASTAAPAAASATTAAPGGGYSYGGGSPATTAGAAGAQLTLSSGHLVGPDGKTVYIFDKDSGTTSACTGACASVWPALTSSGAPSAGAGVDAAKLSTATGQAPDQVTYNGHLLYEFKGDTAAGQTNGTKIPGWHDVNAAGTAAS